MFNRNFLGRTRSAIFVTTLLISAASHADGKSGFYLGLGAGAASQTIDEIEFDQKDTAFKLYGGYSFNRFFATELAYINGGAPNQHYGTADLKIESTGFTVAALGKLPIGDTFSLFGKAGYVAYTSKATLNVGIGSESSEEDDEDLLYGVGAELYVGNHFTLRAEYEAVDVPDGDFSIASLNGVVRF